MMSSGCGEQLGSVAIVFIVRSIWRVLERLLEISEKFQSALLGAVGVISSADGCREDFGGSPIEDCTYAFGHGVLIAGDQYLIEHLICPSGFRRPAEARFGEHVGVEWSARKVS